MAGVLPGTQGQEAGPFCLTTVVLGTAILDFEAYAVVVSAKRHFLPVRRFWIAAALLFAEGEEVPTTVLASAGRDAATQNAHHFVSREVRQLRRKPLSCESGVLITATRHGYRLTLTGCSGRSNAAGPWDQAEA